MGKPKTGFLMKPLNLLFTFRMPALRDRSTRSMIRLAYHGCANRPFFHIVVARNRKPRNTRLEQIGTYDPMPNIYNEKLVAINFDRLKYWYTKGCYLTKPIEQILGMYLSLLDCRGARWPGGKCLGLRIQRSGVRAPLGSNRVVSLRKAHLLPKSTGNTQESVASSQHD